MKSGNFYLWELFFSEADMKQHGALILVSFMIIFICVRNDNRIRLHSGLTKGVTSNNLLIIQYEKHGKKSIFSKCHVCEPTFQDSVWLHVKSS